MIPCSRGYFFLQADLENFVHCSRPRSLPRSRDEYLRIPMTRALTQDTPLFMGLLRNVNFVLYVVIDLDR